MFFSSFALEQQILVRPGPECYELIFSAMLLHVQKARLVILNISRCI